MALQIQSIGSVFALALTTLLPAQGYGTSEQLIAKREQKLQSEFLRKADWIIDYDQARAEAKLQEKLIFAYFTRSYQPSPVCDALENGPFSEEAFAEFGRHLVLFTHVTSYVANAPYAKLLTDKGGTVFPTIMILDETGEVLFKQTDSERNVDTFRDMHDTVRSWLSLKARADAGEKGRENELFLVELKLNKLGFDVARVQRRGLKDLTEQQDAEISRRMINLEFDWIISSPGGNVPEDIIKRLIQMKGAGRIPTGPSARKFWTNLLEHGRVIRDADLFEDALDGMRKVFGDEERYAGWIAEMEKLLAELRGGPQRAERVQR